ncbi:MAG TPA: hypothetical protein V6C82_10920, partial [Chroococcales cyanobacterium]
MENPPVPLRKVYTEEALRSRRKWASEATGVNLASISGEKIPSAPLFEGNIESHIGFAMVPIGLAGPVLISGEHAKGVFYLPMATTEGALVASCTRGMRAVTESGGATVRVVSDQMMRAPMFSFETLTEAMVFAAWVRENEEKLRSIAEAQTRVGKLLSAKPVVLGDTVCVQLSFFTGDAYGANMIMKCNWAICQWILSAFHDFSGINFLDWYVDSQLGAEKKVTAKTYASGLRGKHVIAEVHLKREALQRILHVSPEDLFESFVAGLGPNWAVTMLGCNVNFANAV